MKRMKALVVTIATASVLFSGIPAVWAAEAERQGEATQPEMKQDSEREGAPESTPAQPAPEGESGSGSSTESSQ